jgi:hypothetical protein
MKVSILLKKKILLQIWLFLLEKIKKLIELLMIFQLIIFNLLDILLMISWFRLFQNKILEN